MATVCFLQLEGPKATVFLIYQQNHHTVLATSRLVQTAFRIRNRFSKERLAKIRAVVFKRTNIQLRTRSFIVSTARFCIRTHRILVIVAKSSKKTTAAKRSYCY